MKSKAIFLLVIFLLNTLVGFACALTMDGQYGDVHKDHHHVHSNLQPNKQISGLSISPEDHCCKTLVNDLLSQSKQIPQNGKLHIVLPMIWLPDFIYALLAKVTDVDFGQNVYVNHKSRPPKENIRIVIQSFQI